MFMLLSSIVLIVVFSSLYFLHKKHIGFNWRVLAGAMLGLVVGLAMKNLYSPEIFNSTLNIYKVFGLGFVNLLKMLVFPVVIIGTLHAMTKIQDKSILKSASLIIGILLITTGIAAGIAISLSIFFDLSSLNLSSIVTDHNTISSLDSKISSYQKPLYEIILGFISTNPFDDMTGSKSTSLVAVVIFCILLGLAFIDLKRKEPELASKFTTAMEVLHKLSLKLVAIVLRLTPYGIFALIFNIVATTSIESIRPLVLFVVLTYTAIILMFIVHLVMISFFKVNPLDYLKKIAPLLLFAFTSRSSVASIPLSIETQTEKFGISESLATISATFGSILGQNGCAGIYPAMLAVFVAPSMGIDITSLEFIVSLILVIMISSIGIAGVGGGATFAAIAVFGFFGFPLTIVALLISIEPLLDMARTALNVNGVVVSSLITNKLEQERK